MICRPAADACDLAERCLPTSAVCPANRRASEGANCTDGDPCTTGEMCRADQCTPRATIDMCINRDGCCPPRCARTDDADCNRVETDQLAVAPPVQSPGPPTAADADGDGDPDIIVGDSGQPTVGVLRNDGDGNFTRVDGAMLVARAGGGTGASGGLSDLVPADLNGDGYVDLVRTLPASGELATLFGDGAGHFADGPRAVAGAGAGRLALRALSGDTVFDALVATDSGLVLMHGTGGGAFTRATVVAEGSRVADFALADVDGDGHLDVIVALPSADAVQVFLARSGGVFDAGPTLTAAQPETLVAGDFTGDGVADLAVASAGDGALTLFTGTGSGFAATPRTRLTGLSITRLLRTDLNGDGLADLVSLDASTGLVSTFLGRGDGAFDGAADGAPTVETNGPARGLAVADMNGDFLTDVIISGMQIAVGVVTSNGPPLLAGDATGDGTVDGADIDRLIAELFDGDGVDALSCGGGSARSAAGADANRDSAISAADVTGARPAARP